MNAPSPDQDRAQARGEITLAQPNEKLSHPRIYDESARDQHRVVEIKQHIRLIFAIRVFEREVTGLTIANRHQTQAKRAQITTTGHLELAQNFRPGKNRIPGKGRIGVRPGIDRGNPERIAKPVE